MKIVKFAALGLVGLVVLLFLVSLLLPTKYAVARSTVIAAAPEKIYPLIAAPAQWPKWGVWNRRDPNMKVTFSGSPAGAGAAWKWESASEGNGIMEFTGAQPNQQIAYKLTFPDFSMSSTGVLRLEPQSTPGTTKITWTTEGEMAGLPLWRYMGLMMDKMVGPDFEGGLRNLKELAEKAA